MYVGLKFKVVPDEEDFVDFDYSTIYKIIKIFKNGVTVSWCDDEKVEEYTYPFVHAQEFFRNGSWKPTLREDRLNKLKQLYENRK